ncbi:transmembrane protease serine 9-like [Hyla sarda]|uniref:transmembrane protease serine 9-like n=1 Tax=Hyla sarda TaxID=327740 RepID=UPI0024C28DB1|nr:transmembrane protease serine 9-like [Hyla sarda]
MEESLNLEVCNLKKGHCNLKVTTFSDQAAVDASSVCGSPVVSGRIVGGTDALDGEWPWQVSLLYNIQGKLYHICGGSLISSQWVMSAAHCFQNDVTISRYYVLLGAYQLQLKNFNEALYSLSDVRISTQYINSKGIQGDIALLKLSVPVTYTNYIRPICLPSSSLSFPTGMDCWVSGWGDIGYNGDLAYPLTLQKVMVPLIDYKTCDTMYHMNSTYSSFLTLVYNTMRCAGYAAGGKGSCQGDSGGPLMCKVNGVWYQVGIVSWGEGCAKSNRPGVYTLVSAYQSLIQSLIPGLIPTTTTTTSKSSGYMNMSRYVLTLLPMAASVSPLFAQLARYYNVKAFMGSFCSQTAGICSAPTGHSNAVVYVLVGSKVDSTDPNNSNRIYGGTDAQEGEWPWQVSLQADGSHFCGGSLISSQWVLSAAHCFEGNLDPASYKVKLGLYNLNSPTSYEITANVEQIIPHPDFVKIRDKGDMALIKLSSPVSLNQYIQTIRLPDESSIFSCGYYCWVTGWGATENASSPSNGILQKVSVPLINYKTCDQLYHVDSPYNASTVVIHDYEICAGFVDGKKDSCQGDSGGPLVCNIQNVWYQAGVVSWGEDCGVPFRPGVYSRVAIYQNWIKQYVPDVVFSTVPTVPSTRAGCFNYVSDPASSPLWVGQGTLVVLTFSVMFCTLWSSWAL